MLSVNQPGPAASDEAWLCEYQRARTASSSGYSPIGSSRTLVTAPPKWGRFGGGCGEVSAKMMMAKILRGNKSIAKARRSKVAVFQIYS